MSSHKVCHLLSSPVLLRKFTIFGTKTSRGAALPQIFVWGNTALSPRPPPLPLRRLCRYTAFLKNKNYADTFGLTAGNEGGLSTLSTFKTIPFDDS